MSKTLNILAVFAGMTLAANVASAATVGPIEQTGGMTSATALLLTDDNGADNEIDFRFIWDGSVGSAGAVTFTTETAFDIFFTDYGPSKTRFSTNFVLRSGDTFFTTGDNTSDGCSAGGLASITGDCTRVTGPQSIHADSVRPNDSLPLFAQLAAGTYTLGVFEQNNLVNSRTASFKMIENDISPVPVPASGLLLGTMLLGAGAVARRRRKAA